jgi:hypothetical protein
MLAIKWLKYLSGAVMSIKSLSRCGAMFFLVALSAGCSSLVPWSSSPSFSETGSLIPETQCRWNPRSCIHEGQYEVGERNYAELEAARLNQAALEKLRSSSAR